MKNCPGCPQDVGGLKVRVNEHSTQEKAFQKHDKSDLTNHFKAKGMTAEQVTEAVNFCNG